MSYCYHSFAASGDVQRHMVVHTGDKPHLCDICGRGECKKRCVGISVIKPRVYCCTGPFVMSDFDTENPDHISDV